MVAKNEPLTFEQYSENEKETKKKLDNKKNKNSMVKYSYFYIFLLGGFAGTIYEEILTILATGAWESRAGMLWLPFNPLYGFGVVGFVLALSRIKKWYHQITYGAIIGGTFEYMCSFLQELFTGSTSWNYDGVFTNIDGRTTIVFALAWGFMGFALVRYVYPLVVKGLEKIPYKVGNIVTIVLMVIMFSLIAVSYMAVVRAYLLRLGHKPLTFIGKFFDKFLPQEYLEKYYTNMIFK